MRKAVVVLVLFILLTVGLTWPLSLHVASGVEDLNDALLNTWILAWDGHQLLTNPLHLFDANIFYPYQNTLAFSEIILPQALIALPFSLATGNPVLGYNLALLASFVLSGFCAYLLVLRLTRSRWAGIAAGVVFAFGAYKMSNLAQAQLLALQWLPLALLYLWRTLDYSVPGVAASPAWRNWRNAFLLTLFVALQTLSSFYYAILAAITIALALAVHLLLRRRASLLRLIQTLLALVVAAMIVLPFVVPYLHVERDLGFRRAIAESEPFSASLAQYANALPGSWLYTALVDSSPVVIGGYPLDALFPGLTVLFLAALGVALWRKRASAWLFPLALALVSLLLSLGPALTLSPGHTLPLPFALPYQFLFALPGMQALRAPVRFAALLFLALSILAGLGVASITRRPTRGSRAIVHIRRQLAGGVIVALLVAECLTVPGAHIAAVPTGDAVPPVYRWLAQQAPGVILELPMLAATPERGLLNQYFSIYHWQNTPDGYSGFIPPKHGEIVYEMQQFPSERSVSMLQGMDVRYLVVHTDLIADWERRSQGLAAHSGDIIPVQSFGAVTVFQVRVAGRAGPLQGSIYVPAEGKSGAAYTASLILTSGAGHSVITRPARNATVEIVWRRADNAPVKTERQTVALPVVVSEAAVVPITLQSPEAGSYTLNAKVQLPQGNEVASSGAVTMRKAALPGAQAIPVRLLSGAAETDRYHAGDTLSVKLRWRALGKVDAYYSVYVRLLDNNGEALVQEDGQPAQGTRPTLLWVPGTEIQDNWTLQIPALAPSGRYTLEAGIYRPDDLSPRLTLDSKALPVERLLLGTIYIAPTLDVAGIPSLPIDAFLGDKIALIGYDIEGCTWLATRCSVQRGKPLAVTLYWRAEGDVPVDYMVFVHLAGADGKPQAQDDSQPRQGAYPTSVWRRGDVVTSRHVLAIPTTVAAGEYELLTGMYLPTGVRLPTTGKGDAIALLSAVVQ